MLDAELMERRKPGWSPGFSLSSFKASRGVKVDFGNLL
jgi:hypothetical protein